MKKFVLLFPCFLLVINISAFCQKWTTEQKEAWEICEKMYEFWANRDLDGYMSCLHENFIGWYSEDPVPIDKEALKYGEEHWLSTTKILRYKIKPLSINVTGDIAIINSNCKSARKYEGGNILNQSRWTDVCKKENGKWLILGSSGGIYYIAD